MNDKPIFRVRVNGQVRGTYRTKDTATKKAFELHKKAPSAAMLIERIGPAKGAKTKKTSKLRRVVTKYIVMAGRVFKM